MHEKVCSIDVYNIVLLFVCPSCFFEPLGNIEPVYRLSAVRPTADIYAGHESHESHEDNEGWAGKFVGIFAATLRQNSPDTSAGGLGQFLLPLRAVLGCSSGPLWAVRDAP